jgi:sugar phosphate isomerase/epimerase
MGVETPLGKGDVGMDRFVAKLKEVGYFGPLTIKREITGEPGGYFEGDCAIEPVDGVSPNSLRAPASYSNPTVTE